MTLYIDETENEKFFIVTGLLLESEDVANSSYRSFKKKAKNLPIPKRDKQVVFTEFKSTILDKHYQSVKTQMMLSLSEVDKQIIYSSYTKKTAEFPQNFKEDTYIALLSHIVLNIKDDIYIIFDAFNKDDFEKRIIEKISTYKNVQDIIPCDSQLEPGLQYVDNICSIIRHHISGTDIHGFYQYIETCVREA